MRRLITLMLISLLLMSLVASTTLAQETGEPDAPPPVTETQVVEENDADVTVQLGGITIKLYPTKTIGGVMYALSGAFCGNGCYDK